MIKVFPDIEELNRFAAEKFIEISKHLRRNEDRFTVALAGGSTPKSLYRLLASEKFKNRVDWKKVFFFLGDERNVLPDDEESNFFMAFQTLLNPLGISENQVFRWQTELEDAEKIAENYEQRLKDVFEINLNPPAIAGGSDRNLPRFDLILLGMGADAHTASLFPYTKALHETKKLAVANPVEKLQTTRLTLTFPAINNAANVIFLVAGAEKAEALREVLEGDFQPDEFPSQKVKLNDGNLFWLIDSQAAQLLQ
jgi:6-phosphogluconolactonase